MGTSLDLNAMPSNFLVNVHNIYPVLKSKNGFVSRDWCEKRAIDVNILLEKDGSFAGIQDYSGKNTIKPQVETFISNRTSGICPLLMFDKGEYIFVVDKKTEKGFKPTTKQNALFKDLVADFASQHSDNELAVAIDRFYKTGQDSIALKSECLSAIQPLNEKYFTFSIKGQIGDSAQLIDLIQPNSEEEMKYIQMYCISGSGESKKVATSIISGDDIHPISGMVGVSGFSGCGFCKMSSFNISNNPYVGHFNYGNIDMSAIESMHITQTLSYLFDNQSFRLLDTTYIWFTDSENDDEIKSIDDLFCLKPKKSAKDELQDGVNSVFSGKLLKESNSTIYIYGFNATSSATCNIVCERIVTVKEFFKNVEKFYTNDCNINTDDKCSLFDIKNAIFGIGIKDVLNNQDYAKNKFFSSLINSAFFGKKLPDEVALSAVEQIRRETFMSASEAKKMSYFFNTTLLRTLQCYMFRKHNLHSQEEFVAKFGDSTAFKLGELMEFLSNIEYKVANDKVGSVLFIYKHLPRLFESTTSVKEAVRLAQYNVRKLDDKYQHFTLNAINKFAGTELSFTNSERELDKYIFEKKIMQFYNEFAGVRLSQEDRIVLILSLFYHRFNRLNRNSEETEE